MDHELQKASFGKRIAAWILDGILVCVLATGFAFLLSALLGYDSYSQTMNDGYKYYADQYGISFDISAEEYRAMSEAELKNWNAAYDALVKDEAVMHAYNQVVNLTMVIASVAILLAVMVWEFVVPMILQNGQTVGKKVFGLCLVRVDGVEITTLQLVTRTLLGKYTVETMIPVFILLMIFWGIAGFFALVVLLALVVSQLICLCITRTNAALHDQMAGTVVVDMNSQRIFKSTEELIAYQKRVAAEYSARQTY